jgi:hypothetical protein
MQRRDKRKITGRPQHPRTQGLVEQVHDSLHKLLASKSGESVSVSLNESIPLSVCTPVCKSPSVSNMYSTFSSSMNSRIWSKS